jgi:hypothetical protein
VLNLGLSVVGLTIIVFVYLTSRPENQTDAPPVAHEPLGSWRKPLFISLLVFCLIIPSDWTQDVAERYGKRHPGLVNTAMYPRLATEVAAE